MAFMDGYKGQPAEDEAPAEKPMKQIIAEVPYAFGDLVWHRARNERCAGIVCAFVMTESEIQIGVKWGDDLAMMHHYAWELTDEEPL